MTRLLFWLRIVWFTMLLIAASDVVLRWFGL